MKDRVREAVFNLLADRVRGRHAVDLFAGTGALGLEAISRGAARATLIERHLPTARLIEENVRLLGVEDRVEVCFADAFVWGKRFGGSDLPLVVFCSPPYDFYVKRPEAMLELLASLWARAALGSVFAVEADERFDFGQLPQPARWQVRAYPPAVVGIGEKNDEG